LSYSCQFGTADNAVLHQAEELICPGLTVLISTVRLSIEDSIPNVRV